MTPEAVAVAQANGLTPDETRRVLDALKGTIHCRIEPSAKVHPTARVWHYAVILQDVVIGEDVSIGSHCEIGRGSIIGARSRIGSGTFLPPNTVVGEDTFIGPQVAMSDDRFPVIRHFLAEPYKAEPPVIGNGVSIGLGAVLLPGVTIGDGARVAAGAIVTRDVPTGQMIRGEPARIILQGEMSAEARDWMQLLVDGARAIPGQ